jgi:XTP/dITP diphosphohydrolase
MITLVCASANPDKVAEISALLAGIVELVPRPSDVDEDARCGVLHRRG